MTILFFIRSYASIDHLSPIIFKTHERNYKIIIIGTNPAYNFRKNKLINFFLDKKNIFFYDCKKILSPNQLLLQKILFIFEEKNFKFLFLSKIIKKINHLISTYLIQKTDKKENLLLRYVNNIIDISEQKYLAFFDHHDSNLYKKISKSLSKLNIKTITFPHGLMICENRLRRNDWVTKKDFDHDNFVKYDFYDYIFLHNKFDYQFPKTKTDISNKKVKFCKSFRYEKEWVNKIISIYNYKINDFKIRKKDRKKILFIVPKTFSNNNFEEVLKAIKILDSLDTFNLLIKIPVKSFYFIEEDIKKLNLKNSDIYTDIETSVLTNHSDTIIFVDSDVFLDGILLDKVVVHLTYLFLNIFRYKDSDRIISIKSRDELFDILHLINEKEKFMINNEGIINHSINQIYLDLIYPNENNSIENYRDLIKFLEEI